MGVTCTLIPSTPDPCGTVPLGGRFQVMLDTSPTTATVVAVTSADTGPDPALFEAMI